MKKYFFLLTLVVFQQLLSQKTETLKLKKYKLAILSDTIKETSGLGFFREKLYTFNDGGNPSELYEIDKKSGKILSILKTELHNKDWEAICFDEGHFYLGDIGNNAGTREDLKIYKIPFERIALENSLLEKGITRLDSLKNSYPIDTIFFHYPEQKEFLPKILANDYDAEAMVFLKDKIHLFTKEWKSKAVTHYLIDPKLKEKQEAKKLETYNTNFVVTDAYYYKNQLFVVGYTKKMKVYFMVFNEEKDGRFFSKTPRKFYLGKSYNVGQIEGIAVNNDGIYISGERFLFKILKAPPSFYYIPFGVIAGISGK